MSSRTEAATSSLLSFCGASLLATVDEKDRCNVVLLAAALCQRDVDRAKDVSALILGGFLVFQRIFLNGIGLLVVLVWSPDKTEEAQTKLLCQIRKSFFLI